MQNLEPDMIQMKIANDCYFFFRLGRSTTGGSGHGSEMQKNNRRKWLRDPHPPAASYPTPKRMGKNLLREGFAVA